jgi:hypothetical protein
VPTPLSPRWASEYVPDEPRERFLSRLEAAAQGTGWSFAQPEARHLLGAARAFAIGALRGTWSGGFLVEARWAPAATVRASMAWHLWQVLSSPAGFALERFSGTPVDAEDAAAVNEVVREFPAARLREVVLELGVPLALPERSGSLVRDAALPWLTLDGPLPAEVRLDGPSRRPRLVWRQHGPAVSINGRSIDDRCVWSEPLWLELRQGDVVEVGDVRRTVVATADAARTSRSA